jgi:type II secretory pathway component PulK
MKLRGIVNHGWTRMRTDKNGIRTRTTALSDRESLNACEAHMFAPEIRVHPCPSVVNNPDHRNHQRGSVLIIVLWVAFGLVSLALYFANSMSLEMRAGDNRAASIEAEQAILGGARYVSNLLATAQEPGNLPDTLAYRNEAVPVGEAHFWIIGRSALESVSDEPVFGLVDEAAKLNLNVATSEMLQFLPGMTAALAASIQDWRDTDDDVAEGGGAESQTYLRLNPPYRCKNADFESVEELRLVSGAYLEVLYGEDANLNGLLDPNENDALTQPPNDNRNGRLDPGLLDQVTVWTRESNIGSDGSNKVNVTTLQQNRAELQTLMQNEGIADPEQIVQRVAGAQISSVLHFYKVSQMSPEDFAKIEANLTFTNQTYLNGLVNVNTATEAVLSAIPGIGIEKAASLIAYRASNRSQQTSIAWVTEVLTDDASLQQAGRYLTGKSYQFSADIAAVGRFGRGYRRVKFIFDTSDGAPRIIHRQDLTHLGWALGREARNALLTAKTGR